MRIGDASRSRRFADPARQRWYAFHRAVRFALRMRETEALTVVAACRHAEMSAPRPVRRSSDHFHSSTRRQVLQESSSAAVQVRLTAAAAQG